jgi:hypothetical protein
MYDAIFASLNTRRAGSETQQLLKLTPNQVTTNTLTGILYGM